MSPSAREVEEVVLSAVRRGEWAHAANLLAGAAQLRCVPTIRTYAEVIAANSLNGTWEDAVRVVDLLQSSPLSSRALLCTAADALLMKPSVCATEKLFSIILAARRRRVQMEVRHQVQCSRLLVEAGDWQRALTLGAYGRPVRQIPALASPMMLAAATGRRWMEGSRIMADLLISGTVPGADVAKNYIRCFTPTGPWWRALAVVSVLVCSSDAGVTAAACGLLREVRSGVGEAELAAKKARYQTVLRLVERRGPLNDVSVEEASYVLNALGEERWEEALGIIRAFPSLLSFTPRPRAVLLPTAVHKTQAGCYKHWEFVWKVLSSGFSGNSAEHVFGAATCFASYVSSACRAGEEQSECMREVELMGNSMSSSIVDYRALGGGLPEYDVLNSFVRASCACGWWKDALLLSERRAVVLRELLEVGPWQAALAVYEGMPPSARERMGPKLEYLFISRGLWVPALQYAQQRLPRDTLPLRNLSIPLCAALGQWGRTLHLLDRYVSLPTDTEKILRKKCITKDAEDSVRAACEAGDWVRALRAWSRVYSVPRRQRQPVLDESRRRFEMVPEVVKQLAKLLLAAKRYDECCGVVSFHTPTPSDPVVLRCLQLFNGVRSSPLTYGRLLQEYREAHKHHRVLVECYAVLALCVSGNFCGAFSVVQQLTAQNFGRLEKDVTVFNILEEVPHLKAYLPLILCAVATPARAVELEAVMVSLTWCIKLPNDTDLFNRPLSALWGSGAAEPRACAFRVAVFVLQHSLDHDLPSSWVVMDVVARSLEDSSRRSVIHMLCESAVRRLAFDAEQNGTESGQHGVRQGKGQEEVNVVFRSCATAFARKGLWEHALASIQHCETVDAGTLLSIIVFTKELRERRLATAQRIVLELETRRRSDGDEPEYPPGTCVSKGRVESALVALTELRAWRAALVLFNSEEAQLCLLSSGVRKTSSTVVGLLVSCVAVSGPWELSLRLLEAVHCNILPSCPLVEKGLTDVLGAVHSGSGAAMCSQVLLFMVERMGVVPTSRQYGLLLRSCLEVRLTVAERELCARTLKRLSRCLNERQVVDLVGAISTCRLPSNPWNEEGHPGALYSFPTGPLSKKRVQQLAPALGWMREDRPFLNDGELSQLCEIAPLVTILNAQDMERLSQQFLGGRFASFELMLVLQHYRQELMEMFEQNGDDSVNVSLLEHCRGSRLLHIMLVPYEQLSHNMICNGNESSAMSFLQEVRWGVFRGFASVRTVAAVWEACRSLVSDLAAGRWTRLCECELLTEVRRRRGRPPVSLITRPGATRSEIAKYWATYGRIVWPELYFSGPELCQLAVYVPLLEPLLRRDQELRELVFGIHASHFAFHSIPSGELLFRRPRSPEAIRAVIHLVFGKLKRLHSELDADKRGARRYYRHTPDMVLWRRTERAIQKRQESADQSAMGGTVEEQTPRSSLALRILYHYRRSTKVTLKVTALAALFSACAADVEGGNVQISCQSRKQGKRLGEISWWMLSIYCARFVEPNLTLTMWRDAMKLAVLPSVSNPPKTLLTSTYGLEDINDISLRATMQVLMCQVNDASGNGRVPFSTSLLLVDQLKESLSAPHHFPSYCVSSDVYRCYRPLECASKGESDALTVWSLLQTHRCLEKMEPLHANLVRRMLLGGKGFGETGTCSRCRKCI